MKQFLRIAFFTLAIGVAVAACGGDAETADAAQVPSTTDAEVVEETTTTAAPETTTTAPPETAAPETNEPESSTTAPALVDSAQVRGLTSFGTAVLGADDLADLSADEVTCLVEGLGGLDRSSGFDTLPIDDQVAAIEVGIDCAPATLRPIFLSSLTDAASGVDAGLLDAVGGQVGDCLYDGLSVDDADQRNRIAALVYSGANEPSPADAIDPGANLLADCIDFDVLSTAIGGDGALLQAGIDETCVDETFDRETAVQFYGDILAEPLGTAEAGIPDSLLDVFACVDIGQILADQFGGADVISEEEVACINEAFRSPELLNSLVAGAGDLPPDALGGLFECLDPETLGNILSGGGS